MSSITYADKSKEIVVLTTTQSKEINPLDNNGSVIINFDIDVDIALSGYF